MLSFSLINESINQMFDQIYFRLPFSIIWRDDLKDDSVRIPCSTLLIALGSTASGL